MPVLRPRTALTAALASVGIVVLTAGPAGAHTGTATGSATEGLAHPLLGPDHLLAMLAVGGVAALARDRRIAWLTPLAFLTGMALGALGGVLGYGMPAVELAIALSVVTFGLALALERRAWTPWLPAAALLAGALHGHAHGAELPAGALPVAYVMGFLAATAALHATGAAGGRLLGQRMRLRVAAGSALAVVGVALALTA